MLLALAAANSPLAPVYNIIHHTPVHVRFGPLIIDGPLVRWVNEGLMVIFFLLVGLEIKRQFHGGYLSTPKSAALPALAALGGMIVPAALYASLNWADPVAIRGWAIPTATDIVLALGVMSLLGPRVPPSLKIFLMALAIFDDIGAIFIIGMFYAQPLSTVPLFVAFVAIAGLALLNRFCIVRPIAYTAVGLVLWVAMLKSGAQPALAGFLIALAVPLNPPGNRGSSPLRETEQRLHPWGMLMVVPLFTFFNAGISIDADAIASALDAVPLAIAGGLFLGKQLGVFATARIAVAFGLAQLPQGVTWTQLYGAALLAGIGFTMSLFIASLAFSGVALNSSAKLGILIGSLMSAAVGVLVVGMTTCVQQDKAKC